MKFPMSRWARPVALLVAVSIVSSCGVLPRVGPNKREIFAGSVQREGDAFHHGAGEVSLLVIIAQADERAPRERIHVRRPLAGEVGQEDQAFRTGRDRVGGGGARTGALRRGGGSRGVRLSECSAQWVRRSMVRLSGCDSSGSFHAVRDRAGGRREGAEARSA